MTRVKLDVYFNVAIMRTVAVSLPSLFFYSFSFLSFPYLIPSIVFPSLLSYSFTCFFHSFFYSPLNLFILLLVFLRVPTHSIPLSLTSSSLTLSLYLSPKVILSPFQSLSLFTLLPPPSLSLPFLVLPMFFSSSILCSEQILFSGKIIFILRW